MYIRTHEEQHAINNLLNQNGQRRCPEEISNPGIFSALTEKEQELLLKRYLRWRREYSEEQAKDEILAHYKEGRRSFSQIFEVLSRSEEEGGIYEYLNKKQRVKDVQFLTEKIGNEHEEMITRYVDEVFVEEYKVLLKKSVEAVELLTGLYSKEQVIAILQRISLEKWSTLTKRLTKEQLRRWMEENGHEE